MNKYELVRKIEEFAPLETQESWDALYFESEGEAVVKVGTTYTIKEPGIYRALGMYPAIAGGAEVYLVVEGNGQTAASLTKPSRKNSASLRKTEVPAPSCAP